MGPELGPPRPPSGSPPPPMGSGPPLGFDLDDLRRGLRRRVMWLLVGVVVVVVGLQIDPAALHWPLWSRSMVWIAGVAVASFGTLGGRAGSGCLAQILGTILLGSLVCNATATSDPKTYVLMAWLVGAVVVSAVLRRRARARAAQALAQWNQTMGAASGVGGDAPGDGHAGVGLGAMIDVNAHDKTDS